MPSIINMFLKTVHVSAPSRLHFGLISFGNPKGREYGGAGVMVEKPGLKISITASDRFHVSGPLSRRVEEFVDRWSVYTGRHSLLPCRITIHSTAGDHLGLGVGTQLGLAVAAGLNSFFQLKEASPVELARSVKRGLRSAVGTYGFFHGGLIAELGKESDESLGRMERRVEVPQEWRFVLMRFCGTTGLAGKAERQAFKRLPPVQSDVSQRLLQEMRSQMLPALADQRFDDFSESVYRYGYEAGMCFAVKQGGPYCGSRQAELIEQLRDMGISGVGQSSWGPTLFALCPDADTARSLIRRLQGQYSRDDLELQISPPNNSGATIESLC